MFPEGRILDFVIVGVVALIVVGPKDLPVLMRRVGRFLAQMRAMAAEFRASFDEMARQSELDELRREVEALRTGQVLGGAIAPATDAHVQGVFDEIHASLRDDQGQPPPVMAPMTPVTHDLPGEAVERQVAPPPLPAAATQPLEAPAMRGDA